MAFQIVCLLSTLAAAAFAQSTNGNCGALGENGATVESGFVYYLCDSGKLYAKGCVTLDKKRVEIGQTVDYRQSRLSCDLKGTLPALSVKACVLQGQEHPVGSAFNDDKNTYTCEQGKDEATITQIGCADGGKQVKYGEKLTKTDGVYVCDKAQRRLVKSGCVQEGKEYNLGDSFDSGDMWLNCTRGGAKPSGCINQGKRLNDGDRFFDKDVIYECYIEAGKVDLRVAGCVQNDGGNTVERRLGCFWTEGPEPLQYEWTCRKSADGKSATKLQIRCNYKVSKGVYNIDPGCYRVVDKSAFGCVQSGQTLNLQSFQGDAPEKAAEGAGLKSC